MIKLFIFHLFLVLSVCASAQTTGKVDWLMHCSKEDAVMFFSDFNQSVEVFDDSRYASLSFSRGSRQCPEGWANKFQSGFRFGYSQIQFIGGTAAERWSRVIQEDSNNKVLNFGLRDSYFDLDSKDRRGRVQMVLSGNRGLRYVYVKMRMKLDRDLLLLRYLEDPVHWLGITDWWNNGGWGSNPYPFSFFVDMAKSKGLNKPLNFTITARTFDYNTRKYSPVWFYRNSDFEIPVNEWMEVEYKVSEGNKETGWFVMTITDHNSIKHEIFNIQNYTHHPEDPSPDGFQDINPIKLYTSEETMRYFFENKKEINVYWDDLLIVGCRDISSECPTAYLDQTFNIQGK